MNTPRDPDRLIRAFLDEGATELPDRTFDAVRAAVDRTRQRTTVFPWRIRRMSLITNIASATLAAVLLAAIGFNVLPQAGDDVLTGSPSPSPSPAASPLAYTWPGNVLAAGTYATDFAFDLPVAVTFTVGDGWQAFDLNIVKDDRVSLMLLAVDNLHADVCSSALADPPVGPTVDDLATALSALPGLDATTPVDTALGGLSGRYVEYTLDDVECSAPAARIFDLVPFVCDEGCGGTGPEEMGIEFGRPDVATRAWILDAGGRTRIAIQAVSTPDATPDELAELQAVIDSIRIERTVEATPAPQPASASEAP